MTTIDRASAISYLAELYKTAGDGKKVLPHIFTEAVCDICDVSFVENFDKYAVRDDVDFRLASEVEKVVKLFKSKLTGNSNFLDVYLFVKWDLISEKLKQLNKEAEQ